MIRVSRLKNPEKVAALLTTTILLLLTSLVTPIVMMIIGAPREVVSGSGRSAQR